MSQYKKSVYVNSAEKGNFGEKLTEKHKKKQG